MIEVRELRKHFGQTKALSGFSLNVAAGEIVGLVGPNGAGKTTLIKILATLTRPDGGDARIDGLDVTQSRQDIRRLVGYLPDVPGIYQDMRVGELLDFFAEAFRIRGQLKKRVVLRALERTHLQVASETFVEQLSLGMKQRLLLAKTLLHEPKVLLLDEPATGLDPLARLQLREQLKALRREGVTILISSHILTDLQDICMKVALIDHGRNAEWTEGQTVLDLSVSQAGELICEIDVDGFASEVVEIVGNFASAQVLGAEGSRLRVRISGGRNEAGALLRHLMAAGVSVVRFDPCEPGLEDRYRQTFKQEQL